jgi:TRAP-type uncharacterized transport system fused permease subunit
MKEYTQKQISTFLIDVLGEKNSTVAFPHAYMRFFGYVTCVIITIMIGVIAFGELPTKELGYISILTLALIATFLLKPKLRAKKSHSLSQLDFWVSMIFIFLTILVGIRLASIHLMEYFEWFDYLTYSVAIALILEGGRRVEGRNKPLLYLVIGFIFFYIFFGDIQLAFDVDKGIFSENGVYGNALVTIVDIVYAIIIFSLSFRLVRINLLFNHLAFVITHGRRSGASAGLYAIWASTLYGSINSESRNNIKATGEHTIPVMKRAGYSSEFAASVEVAISGVGQIIPPIMGTAAFAIIVISSFSYFDIYWAFVIPTLLFMFSLAVAVILEARSLSLKPSTLQYTNEIKKQEEEFTIGDNKKHYLRGIVFFIGLIVFFFSTWLYDFSLAECALLSTCTVVILYIISPLLNKVWPSLFPRLKINRKRLGRIIFDTGKDGIDIVIYCAVIGIILFIFQQMNLEKWILEKWILDIFSWPLPLCLQKLTILFIFASITIFLGLFLPTLVVFFILASVTISTFQLVQISELQTYLFIFYYSVLAGITSPQAPLLTKATELFQDLYKKELDKKKLHKISLKLSFALFILPFAWIYHPEIIMKADVDYFFSYRIIETIYITFAILLAILAISVAIFGLFRREENSLSVMERSGLFVGAIFIILSLNFWMILCGIILILFILISDDWQARHNSILIPAFSFVWLMINPKNIPTSVYFTFTSLILIYTIFFTTTGFIYDLNKHVDPWLKNRFHFTLEVDDCKTTTDELKGVLLQETGKNIQTVCTKFYELNISKLYPGEFRLSTNLKTVEFNEKYFRLLPDLKKILQEFYAENIEGDLATCFEERQLEEDLDLNKLSLKECNIFDETPLPLIYLGSNIADYDELNVSVGTIISLHDTIFSNESNGIEKEISIDYKSKFVVKSVFQTRFPDLDELVIVPEGTLSKLFPEDFKNLLIVKIQSLETINELTTIINKMIERGDNNKLSNDFIIDSFINEEFWIIQNTFLNTIQAILIITFLICIFVLISGLSQLMEINKKLIVLMRLSGMRNGAIWMFIFLLFIISTTITCLAAFMLSYGINSLLVYYLFENISFTMNFSIGFNIWSITILTAILLSSILNRLHFSRDIARELDYGKYGHNV